MRMKPLESFTKILKVTNKVLSDNNGGEYLERYSPPFVCVGMLFHVGQARPDDHFTASGSQVVLWREVLR
jgi:hypothetical protein